MLTEKSWQLPEYTELELAPRASEYCVVIPVLNEGERIRAQLARMLPFAKLADVIIVDGGSTDGALDPAYLARHGVRALLTKTGPGKLSAQLRLGLAYAVAGGYAGVVLIDGNNKDNPEAIPRFIEALRAGADHVQGSRYVPGGKAVNTPPSRHYGIRLVHAPLLSLAAGFRYTDTTNGFRAYSRKLLVDPRVQPFRDVFSGYELHYYLAVRAPRLGFRVAEIPVERAYPPGEVPTKIKGWKGNFIVLRTLALACLHRFNPAGAPATNGDAEHEERAHRAHGIRR